MLSISLPADYGYPDECWTFHYFSRTHQRSFFLLPPFPLSLKGNTLLFRKRLLKWHKLSLTRSQEKSLDLNKIKLVSHVLKLTKSCWLLWQCQLPSPLSPQICDVGALHCWRPRQMISQDLHCLKILSKTLKLTAKLPGFKTDTVCLVVLPRIFWLFCCLFVLGWVFFLGDHFLPVAAACRDYCTYEFGGVIIEPLILDLDGQGNGFMPSSSGNWNQFSFSPNPFTIICC